MSTPSTALRSALFLLALASGRARAADWYVDALNGNNANPGTSAAAPWKTITYAVNTLNNTQNVERIHVAAGTYDAALGEMFPIYFRPKQQLLGAGIGLSIVDAGGANVAVMQLVNSTGSVGTETIVNGFDLRNGRYGVELPGSVGSYAPLLQYLDIRGMSGAGIIAVSFRNGGSWGNASPVVQHVTCTACAIGFLLQSGAGGVPLGTAFGSATLEDSMFSGNSLDGVRFTGFRAINTGVFKRCRIESNAGHGSQAVLNTAHQATQTFEECSISSNAQDGVRLAPYDAAMSVTLKSCTVVGNIGAGVRMLPSTAQRTTVLRETLIYGNGDDVDLSGGTQVDYCDIGDGDFAGSNGNFAADPRFVSLAQQDYRLRVGSPCIEAGDPTQPPDADCSRSDVGAFAHESPQVYCTAKMNSCGGMPAIGWTGASSASATSGFVVRATGTKALKPGLLLYTQVGAAATSFHGGTLCLAIPIQRSPALLDSAGIPGACNGVLQLDLNAFAHGLLGGAPSPNLLTSGTRFFCQFWGRDTPSSVMLSDALEFVVCP